MLVKQKINTSGRSLEKERNKIEFKEEKLIDYIITEYTLEEINEAKKKAMKDEERRAFILMHRGNALIGYLICHGYL